MCVCVYVYTYIHTYTYTEAHIHTNTHIHIYMNDNYLSLFLYALLSRFPQIYFPTVKKLFANLVLIPSAHIVFVDVVYFLFFVGMLMYFFK